MDTTEFQNLPWYGNNDMLETFLDSIGYPPPGAGNRIIGRPQVRVWIPIKFWIYRGDNGNGGPTPTQIQRLMDDLNFRFNQNNNTMIGFYQKCDPTFVNNSTHTEKTLAGAILLMTANDDHGAINVHVIERFASAGTAGFSVPLLNGAMVPRDSYTDGRASGDLAHEIGHVLGLSHTHQYSAWNWRCLTECVSRTRTWPTFNLCPTKLVSGTVSEATGDALRDTPADDNLVSNNACFYNVTFGNDPWGDSYDNPPNLNDRADFRNLMSYTSATNCIDQFSRLQMAVILRTIIWRNMNNAGGWGNSISTFDVFEPDNQSETAREIQLNQVQARSFHQQHNRAGGYVWTTQCDVDWVRFVAPCTNTIEVFTSGIPGQTNANSRLTIFDQNLNQLAQNDDISGTNQFSSISRNFVAGLEYFIRIENMNPNTTGYYNLTIGNPFTNTLTISGNDNLCPSGSYSVTGLPAGATVNWSASPFNLVSFGCSTCPQTTVNSTSNGYVTLTATVSAAICGTVFTRQISKQVYVGVPDINNFSFLFSSSSCISYNNQAMSFGVGYNGNWGCQLNALAGITEVEWQVICSKPHQVTYNAGTYTCQFPTQVNRAGLNVAFSYPTQPYVITFLYRVKNACGWSEWSPGNTLFIQTCSGGWSFAASPNPTNGTVNVALDEETPKTDKTIEIREVKVVDKLGKTVKQAKYDSGNKRVAINISELKADVYFIKVFNGKEWKVQSVIKQ